MSARAVGFAALCAFGLLHWMAMVEPAEPGRALAGLAVALGVAGALVAARRRPGLAPAVVPAGLVLALIAGGLDAEQLWPGRWGELGTALGGGVGGLPGALIPYRGLDPDLRLVIPLGGTLLAVVAALLAFWPRRARRLGFRGPALAVLVGLYAVPAVALVGDAEYLRGALLAVLVLAFLRLERLRLAELSSAGGFAAVAVVLGLVAAPALDPVRPWFDYEAFAQEAVGARSTRFSWDHDYGGLAWSRDGREVLRISSRQRAYWKADNLDLFDGARWVRNPVQAGLPPAARERAGVPLERRRAWTFPIRVTVRNLRSETLPIAGVAEAVTLPGREPSLVRPGVWSAGRAIHRGDAYRADVYVPQPSRRELATAGTAYVLDVLEDTAFDVITSSADGRRESEVYVRAFKDTPRTVGYGSIRPAAGVLQASDLGPVYALSRRLLRRSANPYEYVRAIQRRLETGYRYDETPAPAARTLPGFLFDARAGYCQQFSGAMALLLRMGGVPARVATGFAPGSYNRRAKQHVVRDLDAHSWVEAWFPGVGWVVFDPTPAAAPPRSQAFADAPTAGRGDVLDLGTTRGAGPPAPQEDPPPWGAIALIAAVLLAAAGLARRAWIARTRPRAAPVSELERALRCAGETVAPGTTLAALEARFAASPRAAQYVQALRAERYAPAAAGGPTAAQRRGLRRDLARGRGMLARARTWRALRPRLH